MFESDDWRRLSKRSGATEQRKILKAKLKKRQEKDRLKTLAKARQVNFSETTEDSDSLNSSVNSDGLE